MKIAYFISYWPHFRWENNKH